MSINRKMVIGMFAATLITAMWLFRWDVETASGRAETTTRLDRWTGEIWICYGVVGCSKLEIDE